MYLMYEMTLDGKGRGRTRALFPCPNTERSEIVKLLIRQGRLVDPVGGIGGVMDILLEDGKVAQTVPAILQGGDAAQRFLHRGKLFHRTVAQICVAEYACSSAGARF